MSIHSLPYEPRKVQATEARLDAIYEAAKRGLRGDALALASGLTPREYRALCEFDPLAALAEEKGRADAELEMAGVLYDAARAGDAKAALDVLKHVHGWVAKQAVQVEVNQTISIRDALQAAQERVIEGVAERIADDPAAQTLQTPQTARPRQLRQPLTIEVDRADDAI